MKTSKIIPNRTCISVFLHTVLYCFHWVHRQVVMSAKCTRRLFKVWRNLQNSKLMCYCERREPRLSFEYKFVDHPWKLLKLYPTVHAYLFFFTLYCIVSTELFAHSSLRYEEICKIQKVEGVHLNINLCTQPWSSLRYEEQQKLLFAHGSSLRYEEICQIQNWYVILKGENLGFHLNINLLATLENF